MTGWFTITQLVIQTCLGYCKLSNIFPVFRPFRTMLLTQVDFIQFTFEFFHHYKDPLRGLEHPLEVHNSGMMEILEDRNFVLQRSFLFRREAQFIDDL